MTVTGHGLKDTVTALEGFGQIVDNVVDADVTPRPRPPGWPDRMATFVDGPVRVSVPATSANLGPGFDSLGLALSLRDELEAEVIDRGLVVEVDGEGAGDVRATSRTSSSVRCAPPSTAMERAPPGLRLTCRNVVPHARGLGSSSAAIVGGLALARGWSAAGGCCSTTTPCFRLAAEIEGHPDNVAPALLRRLRHLRARRRRLSTPSPPPSTRGSARSCSCRRTPSRPRSPAGCCRPRCRTPTRPPTRAVRRCSSPPWPGSPSTCSRHPRLPAPGAPRAGHAASLALVDALRADGVPAVVVRSRADGARVRRPRARPRRLPDRCPGGVGRIAAGGRPRRRRASAD